MEEMDVKERILIVDDDDGTCRSLSLILRKKGYETETAGTGRDAIVKARRIFFNLVILDIRLPDVTGMEVLRTFREEYPARMNIIITAYATLQNAVEALNLGANAYIEKPIDHEMLEQKIEDCLKKQQEALKNTHEKLTEFIDEVTEMRSREQMLLNRYYQRI